MIDFGATPAKCEICCASWTCSWISIWSTQKTQMPVSIHDSPGCCGAKITVWTWFPDQVYTNICTQYSGIWKSNAWVPPLPNMNTSLKSDWIDVKNNWKCRTASFLYVFHLFLNFCSHLGTQDLRPGTKLSAGRPEQGSGPQTAEIICDWCGMHRYTLCFPIFPYCMFFTPKCVFPYVRGWLTQISAPKSIFVPYCCWYSVVPILWKHCSPDCSYTKSAQQCRNLLGAPAYCGKGRMHHQLTLSEYRAIHEC